MSIERVVTEDSLTGSQIEILGSHTDYNGGLSLSIARATDEWLLADRQRDTNEVIPAALPDRYSFVIGYDPATGHTSDLEKLERRRQACASSLPTLSIALCRYIENVSDVSADELNRVLTDEDFRFKLGRRGAYLSHIIDENERVGKAAVHLRSGEIYPIGDLMTESGDSALNLYKLDEDSPELRFVYDTVAKDLAGYGAYGIRNLGNGFDATTLALVNTEDTYWYKAKLNAKYKRRFGRNYKFLSLS